MSNNNNSTTTTTTTDRRFQNFAILTVQAERDTWVNPAGTFAALPARLVVADEAGQMSLSMPVVVKAYQARLIQQLQLVQARQLLTIKGELRFDTRQDARGDDVKEYALVAVEIAPYDVSQRPSSYLKVTAHLLEPDMRYSAGGNPWTKVRAFVSMGKERNSDQYRDPLWLSIKAFTDKKTGSERLPLDLAMLPKGSVATFAGWLQYEEFQRADQSLGTSLNLVANKIEPFGATRVAAGVEEGHDGAGL